MVVLAIIRKKGDKKTGDPDKKEAELQAGKRDPADIFGVLSELVDRDIGNDSDIDEQRQDENEPRFFLA